jgi:hypothetical protein
MLMLAMLMALTAVPSTNDTAAAGFTSAAPGAGTKSVTNGCAKTCTTPASAVRPCGMFPATAALLYDGGTSAAFSGGGRILQFSVAVSAGAGIS